MHRQKTVENKNNMANTYIQRQAKGILTGQPMNGAEKNGSQSMADKRLRDIAGESVQEIMQVLNRFGFQKLWAGKELLGFVAVALGIVTLLLGYIPFMVLLCWAPALLAVIFGLASGFTKSNALRAFGFVGAGLGAAGLIFAISTTANFVTSMTADSTLPLSPSTPAASAAPVQPSPTFSAPSATPTPSATQPSPTVSAEPPAPSPSKTPKPKLTAKQRQAVSFAQDYLDRFSISKAVLIDEMGDEGGFSKKDAKAAVAYLDPDFGEEALENASKWADPDGYFAMSCSDIADELKYGGEFTKSQIEYAVENSGCN